VQNNADSELNVLLDFASGLQTHDIATRRHCNYKTVFTFKRNARLRLNIETKVKWMDFLAAVVQLSSYSEFRKSCSAVKKHSAHIKEALCES